MMFKKVMENIVGNEQGQSTKVNGEMVRSTAKVHGHVDFSHTLVTGVKVNLKALEYRFQSSVTGTRVIL